MVGGEFCDEETKNLKDLVKEVEQHVPQKFKNKKTRKDEVGPSKAKAHEKTPCLVKQRKGMDEVNVGSLVKTSTTF
jgi:hypothetical protein